MRLLNVFLQQIVLMACFFVVDQVSKVVFAPLRVVLFTTRWISLEVAGSLNTGLVFSLPVGSLVALLLNTVVLVVVIGYWFSRLDRRESWWLAVMIGGAFGNILDRVAFGGVVDWLVIDWGGFSRSSLNFADLFIMVGAVGWLFAHNDCPPEREAVLSVERT